MSLRVRSCARLITAVLCLNGCMAGIFAGDTRLVSTPTIPLKAPKIWEEKALAGWAVPITGVNATPNFYSEAEYYAAPLAEFRTYPVYHPDREPPGYMEWLKQQDPKPLVDPGEIKSDGDWVQIGQRVFDELDTIQFRTDDPRALGPLRDPDALKQATIDSEGRIVALRWVVEARGRVRLSAVECAGCHLRVRPDGSWLRGAPTNLRGPRGVFAILLSQLDVLADDTGKPLPATEQHYIQFGVPWRPDDLHARFRTMTSADLAVVDRSGFGGTFARFNGSPYFTTKIPDLIGVKDRRYLDATATHRNRGPEDIARYGVLVSVADDGSIGPHRFLTEKQRRLPFRHSDEAMYALGRFIYSLEPPPNPNPFDDRARRGEKIFHDEGCAKCHEPPHYANNQLTPVDGFEPPPNHPDREHIMARSVHTDPSLALLTRKGTGVYKVPSLRGVWYRGLFEHSGSVRTLEDWFDPKRLNADYVPTGWKGPGVKTRAVPGHEFGLDLSPEEKSDLIAFLKAL